MRFFSAPEKTVTQQTQVLLSIYNIFLTLAPHGRNTHKLRSQTQEHLDHPPLGQADHGTVTQNQIPFNKMFRMITNVQSDLGLFPKKIFQQLKQIIGISNFLEIPLVINIAKVCAAGKFNAVFQRKLHKVKQRHRHHHQHQHKHHHHHQHHHHHYYHHHRHHYHHHFNHLY